jgi:hypothetical protein
MTVVGTAVPLPYQVVRGDLRRELLWGAAQHPDQSFALNYIDQISFNHDVLFGLPSPNASLTWVRDGVSPTPNGQIAPGPIGVGYFLLGVVPFLIGNSIFGH